MKKSFYFLNRKIIKVISIIYSIILLFLAIIPIKYEPAPNVSDKIKHTMAFLVFFLLYQIAFNLNRIYTFFIGLIFGTLIEFIQNFLPYRSCDIKDIFADVLGLIVGYLIFEYIKRYKYDPR